MKELSEGGLLFTSSILYETGNKVDLSIVLPNEHILMVPGEVVYVFKIRDSYHVGIRFESASDDVVETLKTYIEKEKRR